MRTLIKLKGHDGEPVYVNVDNIAHIQKADDNHSWIAFGHETKLIVKGTPAEVAEVIYEAYRRGGTTQ